MGSFFNIITVALHVKYYVHKSVNKVFSFIAEFLL